MKEWKKARKKKAEKATKITNEELNSLQDLINNINRHHLQIGQLESQKHSTLHSLAGLNDELVLMREKFKLTYNTDDINRILIVFFYNITNSMSTVNLLTNSIMHSVVFIIFTYCNFSN